MSIRSRRSFDATASEARPSARPRLLDGVRREEEEEGRLALGPPPLKALASAALRQNLRASFMHAPPAEFNARMDALCLAEHAFVGADGLPTPRTRPFPLHLLRPPPAGGQT